MRETLRKRYAALCPYSEKKLDEYADRDCRVVLLCSALAAACLLGWNLHFYGASISYLGGSILLAVYVIYSEIPAFQIRKIENRFYMEYLTYLSKVKHFFLEGNNVPNAVRDAAEESGEEIRRHAFVLYRILVASERKEKVRNYIGFTSYNQYLKLFLVQAYEASEKGDTILSEEKSLFTENLEYLRLLVMEEIYRRKKRNHEFAGYTFVSVIPVFAMPLLRNWGLEFTEDLIGFYNGLGKLAELLTLLVTYGIYRHINRAKEIFYFHEKRDGMRQRRWFVLQKLSDVFEKQKGVFSMRVRMRMLQVGMSDSYGQLILRSLIYAVLACIGIGAFLISIGMRGFLTVFLSGTVTGVVAGGIPFLQLYYRYRLLTQNTEQEIRQFQSVVLMERRLDDITIPELLEDMEIFSRMFKGILRECINSYAAGPETALRRMKEKGGAIHESFGELAEAFLAVDGIGVQKAFAEVESNRAMMEKMAQLEAEIRLEKKKDGMELLSKVPVVLTVGGYFVVPFLFESLKGVSEVFRILEELSV